MYSKNNGENSKIKIWNAKCTPKQDKPKEIHKKVPASENIKTKEKALRMEDKKATEER